MVFTNFTTMNSIYRTTLAALQRDLPEGEARAMAFLILEDAFGIRRIDVYADKVTEFSPNDAARLQNILDRVHHGEPVQYALGRALFCGRYFRVTPATLIPRPETEELVRLVVDDMKESAPTGILDVGTGTGCIAVSLKLALPTVPVMAWDISEAALQIAEENARTLGADVAFSLQDITKAPPRLVAEEGLRGKVIVSNPPYVMEKEKCGMERHVLDYEPATALFVPDDDALRFYHALAAVARYGMADAVYCEINAALGPETMEVFRAAGYEDVSLVQDGYGRDRFVRARGLVATASR